MMTVNQSPTARIFRWTVALALTLSASVVGHSGINAAGAVVDDDAERSWQVNGRVYATQIAGNTVFVGGEFTTAQGPDGSTAARTNLAAFDMSTGELRTAWQANVTGLAVRAIETDGTSLYIGGNFTSIRGNQRHMLAKISVASGIVDQTFHPRLNRLVRDIEVDGSAIYVGGKFTRVDNRPQQRVAKFSRSGVLDTGFAPSVNSRVMGLAKAPGQSRLHIAGRFDSVSGQHRDGVASLDAITGRLVGPAFEFSARPTLGLAVNDDGSRLYGAGGAKGPTGNTATAWSTTSGQRIWRHRTMGDIQAIEHFDDLVYFGFHAGYKGNTETKLLRVRASNGAIDSTFRPRFDRFWGVFGIDASPRGVAVGGEFTRVSSVPARNWARFLDPTNSPVDPSPPPPPPPPVDPPPPVASTTTLAVSKNRMEAGSMVRLWISVAPAAKAVGEVRVTRNGKVLRTLELKRGRASTDLRMPRGLHMLRVKYLGSSKARASVSNMVRISAVPRTATGTLTFRYLP